MLSDPLSDVSRIVISESDLELFDALQENPRAPWTRVGARIGASAATARRRWANLSDTATAWISTYPGHNSGSVMSNVGIRCAPGAVVAVCRALSLHPQVVNVAETSGEFDAIIIVLTRNASELRATMHAIGAIPGIARIHASMCTQLFREGSLWRTGALPRPGAHEKEHTAGAETLSSSRVTTVLKVLEANGRAPTSEIASALGVGEAHARRYVKSLMQQKILIQRLDLALGTSDWPHSLALYMAVPADNLERIAATISQLPGTRLCMAVAGGAYNLYAVVWLHHVREAVEVEARVTKDREVQVLNRGLLHHYHKRMGHLLDDEGRSLGLVPWGASPPDPSSTDWAT